MGDEGIVHVSLERYEELIDMETRAKIIADMLIDRKYMSAKDILRLIGTEKAIKEADRIQADMDRIDGKC